jgi:asparagine synthase (glutamine-hydrolysing)
MCGICGVHSPGEAPDLDVVRGMVTSLRHRGPDGAGIYRDRDVALGHVRLAIIDPAGGAQPLSNEDDRVWVTFNGEIFNHVELRAQLQQRGHRFRTRSDTEVVVHAWEEWGLDCFERFNGQWALALWDRRADRLVLSRDPFGIHPLYYTRAGGRLLFASEIKALFADPAVSRAFDPVGLTETFTFWSPVAPRTAFRGVHQVSPGTALVVEGDRERLHVHARHDFPARGREPRQDLEENVEAVRDAVTRATVLRFERSDVPVGAYLSGGIDSAVTTAVIAQLPGVRLRTFSVRFAEDEYDEGRYQRLMSERLGTAHDDIVVSGREVAEVLPDVVRHAEAPLLRTAAAPLFLLSGLARDAGCKVVVTGEGSDELLAGYDLFREARVREFWARDRGSAARARAVELLYPWMARSPAAAPAFARRFFGRGLDPSDPALSHRPRWTSTSALTAMLAPGVLADADVGAGLVARMPAASASWDPLARAQWLELVTLLPGYLLSSQGDRMLMAHGVEGRFPFLDPDVARLASEIPARHKLLGLDEKHLLKRAFADLVPEEILRRPKQPYRAPDAGGFFADGGPAWMRDELSEPSVREAGVFQPAVVERLLSKFRRDPGRPAGNTDSMRLMAVLTTQLLHRQLIAPAPRAPAPAPHIDLIDLIDHAHHEGAAHVIRT